MEEPGAIFGTDQAALLKCIGNKTHLLACKFCHSLPALIQIGGKQGDDITDRMEGIQYCCGSIVHMPTNRWYKRCGWLSPFFGGFKRHLRFILFRLLLALDGEMPAKTTGNMP